MHIHVRAYPDSKKEIIKELSKGRFHIYVKEPAADNRANRRVMEIIRKRHLGMVVKMVKGHHAPSKLISVTPK